jgi:hypothetical protein
VDDIPINRLKFIRLWRRHDIVLSQRHVQSLAINHPTMYIHTGVPLRYHGCVVGHKFTIGVDLLFFSVASRAGNVIRLDEIPSVNAD